MYQDKSSHLKQKFCSECPETHFGLKFLELFMSTLNHSDHSEKISLLRDGATNEGLIQKIFRYLLPRKQTIYF